MAEEDFEGCRGCIYLNDDGDGCELGHPFFCCRPVYEEEDV